MEVNTAMLQIRGAGDKYPTEVDDQAQQFETYE